LDRAHAWSWFTNDASTWALNDFGTLAIEVEGQHAGFAGLVQPPNFPEPECGWALFDGFQGNGYAAEAGAAIIAHTFATTDLESIVSYIDPANDGSANVAAKIGGIEDHDAEGPANQANRVFRYMRPATGAIQ
jgi:RimJ/RimL family protein N-acetyltransferase